MIHEKISTFQDLILYMELFLFWFLDMQISGFQISISANLIFFQFNLR